MKPRHQIKFGPRPSLGPKLKTAPKANIAATETATGEGDVIRNEVTIGERQLHFARALSDTEKHVREASLTSLREWLEVHGSEMSEDDLQRLWKALFYCVWMADKRTVITTVIRNIVDLFDVVGWPFLETLFSCLMREWFGIDRHRVDKYYELVSTALTKAISTFMGSETFEQFESGLERFLDLLCSRIWQPSRKSGVGLALHVLDVYMDRVMKPVLKVAKSKFGCGAPRLVKLFNMMSEDVFTMAGTRNGWLPSVNRRIHERILARLIEMVEDDENCELTAVTKARIIDRAAKEAFKIASDERTDDSTRPMMYDMHMEFKAFVMECKDERDGDDDDDEKAEGATTADAKKGEEKPKPRGKGKGKGKGRGAKRPMSKRAAVIEPAADPRIPKRWKKVKKANDMAP